MLLIIKNLVDNYFFFLFYLYLLFIKNLKYIKKKNMIS